MGRGGALLVGRAIADDRLAADQRRPRVGHRLVDRLRHLAAVHPVALDRMPAHAA